MTIYIYIYIYTHTHTHIHIHPNFHRCQSNHDTSAIQPTATLTHSHTLALRSHHAGSLLHRAALINVKIDKPVVSQTLSRPHICLGKKALPPIRLLYHVSLVTNVRMRGAFLRIPMMISKDFYLTLPLLVA